MSTNNFSLEKIAARAEIEDVMLRWCRIVDRCNWGAIWDIFHPDGYDDHGVFSGDVKGMVAWLSERHKAITRSMHYITNMQIEFADDDNALVETYSMAVQRYASGGSATRNAIAGGADMGTQPFDMIVTGRYVDHFQRRDGRWKVLNRTVIFDNTMTLPVPEGGAKMGDDWAVSTRDASDPIWALRRGLGLSGGMQR